MQLSALMTNQCVMTEGGELAAKTASPASRAEPQSQLVSAPPFQVRGPKSEVLIPCSPLGRVQLISANGGGAFSVFQLNSG